ncbi:MAG: M23 family metallopeptidase [Chthonomonadales bacterium]
MTNFIPFAETMAISVMAIGGCTMARAWTYLILAIALCSQLSCGSGGGGSVTIAGDGSGSIGTGGGQVGLTGVARIEVPAGALGSTQPVTIKATNDPDVADDLKLFASIYNISNRSSEVRVNIGNVIPTAPVQINLQVPASMAGTLTQLFTFGAVTDSSDQEQQRLFIPLMPLYDTTKRILTIVVAPEAFSLSSDGTTFEVISLIGSSTLISGTNKATHSSRAFNRDALIVPVDSPSLVTSGFKMRTYKGITRLHRGLDFRADSVPVYAAQSGRLNFINSPSLGLAAYIVTDGSDPSLTLYAHLSSIKAPLGPISAGDELGVSGNSGPPGTDKHLHFGYAKHAFRIPPREKNETALTSHFSDPFPLLLDLSGNWTGSRTWVTPTVCARDEPMEVTFTQRGRHFTGTITNFPALHSDLSTGDINWSEGKITMSSVYSQFTADISPGTISGSFSGPYCGGGGTPSELITGPFSLSTTASRGSFIPKIVYPSWMGLSNSSFR